jgi:hypothetical protein
VPRCLQTASLYQVWTKCIPFFFPYQLLHLKRLAISKTCSEHRRTSSWHLRKFELWCIDSYLRPSLATDAYGLWCIDQDATGAKIIDRLRDTGGRNLPRNPFVFVICISVSLSKTSEMVETSHPCPRVSPDLIWKRQVIGSSRWRRAIVVSGLVSHA